MVSSGRDTDVVVNPAAPTDVFSSAGILDRQQGTRFMVEPE